MSDEINNDSFKTDMIAEIKKIQMELNKLKDIKRDIIKKSNRGMAAAAAKRKPAGRTAAAAKRKPAGRTAAAAKRKPAGRTKSKRKTSKRG